MKKAIFVGVMVCLMTNVVSADTFGTGGANEFTIDFVNISGDASSANGTYIGIYKPEGFIDPGYDYRMGTYEITNDQWNKFSNIYGTPTGNPSDAYDASAYWTGTNIPTNELSWYEAAQFVNYLNTSTGHQAAYKFIGTQGTSNYSFMVWESGDVGYDADNIYRNSNAYYFLPTEHEWVKAAYWNGTSLQTYASVGDVTPTQSGWNYWDEGYATDPCGPWDVDSGTEELNGTFNMMGNVWEWWESPYESRDYLSDLSRGYRGGSYASHFVFNLRSDYRYGNMPYDESFKLGFRVASIPEPATVLLLGLGVMMFRRNCG